jgi:hypothetical protein
MSVLFLDWLVSPRRREPTVSRESFLFLWPQSAFCLKSSPIEYLISNSEFNYKFEYLRGGSVVSFRGDAMSIALTR